MLESPANMHAEPAPPPEGCQPHIVSVRSLVEFVLQAGDLTPGGFQRRDRAQLGTQGNKRVQRSRPAGYESEMEIRYRVEGTDPPLEIQGRIDGIYTGKDPVIIEEIKTTTLSLDLVSEEHNQLHWAQAVVAAIPTLLYLLPLIPGIFMGDGTKSVAILLPAEDGLLPRPAKGSKEVKQAIAAPTT